MPTIPILYGVFSVVLNAAHHLFPSVPLLWASATFSSCSYPCSCSKSGAPVTSVYIEAPSPPWWVPMDSEGPRTLR